MPTDWDQIVREQGPSVFRAAWRVLGHEADAEDVVQAVFLEAHRLWRERPVATWIGILRPMATRRALDCLRRRRPLADDALLASLPGSDDPVAVAVGHELAARLSEALAELSPREAEVFCLRHFEEFSYQQIAEQLSITISAASTALNKARAKLAVLLDGARTGE